MHNGGFMRGLFIAILLLAIIGGAAYYAYGAGVAQGLLDSGKLAAPVAPIAPYPYYGMHPFGFGFGVLGCIVPFFLLMLFFTLMRLVFGRRHWGWKMRHMHGDGVPPMFEEWHQRAHDPKPAEK